jgi:cellulose synthase operon protein C
MKRRYAVVAAIAVSFTGMVHGAPQSPSAPPAGISFSADELKAIQESIKEVEHFKEAAEGYRRTVNGIVKRAYEKRRKGLLDTYGQKIRKEESEERVRRIAAITLFEDFLRRYPNDKRWTPDVIFRLAELYFEKSNDEYLQATDQFEKDRDAFERGEATVVPTPPKQDYSQTIELHRKLIREFPRYRLVDGAYYLLGFCLAEMGEIDRGNQAYLSLVCANEHRPPLTDAEVAPTAAPEPAVPATKGQRKGKDLVTASGLPTKPKFDTNVYQTCKPLLPKSRFNPEAWVRIGEYHFDENQLGQAIAAYQMVLSFGVKDNAYFDEALYKQAWTYYRADRFIDAIKHFDELVVFSDQEFQKTGKYGSEMRPEAIQYLAISFAEEDWDGDTQPDPETGLQRVDKFYAGRDKEKHVYEVYRRLADIYFDTTKYSESVKVYKLMLQRWPYRSENPEIQDRVILALERERKFDDAIKEREEFTRLFGKGTEWEQRNRSNTDALKKARDYDEQALIQAAVYHHKLGQDLKTRGVAMSDGNLLQQAANEYALAAKAYEKYIERFPTTKNSYEIRYSYASCLYYSQRFLEAGKIFSEVRDSNLDDRYREEAAFSATKAYEEYIAIQVKEGKLPDPALPKADQPPAQLAAQPLPDPYKKWQESLDGYRKALPGGAKTPRLTYKAAEISYRFIQFDDARKRFSAIFDQYCKDPMAVNAGQAILVTYQLEKNLDKMEEWAGKLKTGKCGGADASATATAAGAGKLLQGIKFKRAQDLMDSKQWDKAAVAFLGLVDADPKGEDADKALNNAAVCYENSKRFESATKIYERIWRDYPQSALAGEAVWRTAINYQRFFEFDKAVNNFLILADSPRFADSEHRVDSIYNAATILENDQAYARSAKLFIRYSQQVGKPKEAAEAYYRAAQIYEKMNDYPTMAKTMRDFVKLHGNAPGQAPSAVEAMYKVAEGADKKNDWKSAQQYYKATISEFSSRGQKPASDAAEFAAHAAFQLAEKRLDAFLKVRVKGAIDTLRGQETKIANEALALKTEYDQILNYKRARWTLAAMFRSGTIYEHFARSVAEAYRTAPIPAKVKQLGQEAVDIYQAQVDELLVQRVTPLEDKAKKLYAECVEKAKQVGVSNQYTEDALARLNAFDPLTYQLLKKPKMELSIE